MSSGGRHAHSAALEFSLDPAAFAHVRTARHFTRAPRLIRGSATISASSSGDTSFARGGAAGGGGGGVTPEPSAGCADGRERCRSYMRLSVASPTR
eukprot:4421604-Prymnesium_polylepis.1